MVEYPCKNCTRTKYPKECGNKNCQDWVNWFLERWEAMRDLLRRTEDA